MSRPRGATRRRRRFVPLRGVSLFVALVLAASASTAVVMSPAAGSADAAATIHVAPWGDDGADGTLDRPVQTLRHAVWRARSGDAIVLRGGVYRENVQIYGKSLDISSAAGERAVFDGATVLTGWQESDDAWFVDGWTRQFPAQRAAPVAAGNPVAGYPDQVFIDGRPLVQVLLRSDVDDGTFFHDTARDRVYIGDDPTEALIEASTKSWALYLNDADGSALTDITVRRFATPSAQLAAIRVHSDDVHVSGVISELNAAAGLSAMGDRITIIDSRFSDNGYLGVHAHLATTLVVQDSAIVGNNKAGFDAKHSAGGLKITTSSGVTIRNNDVSRNAGPGIWTDLSVTSSTISFNRVEGNGRSGIELELSSDLSVVSNVVLGNGEAGIWVLESTDVELAHNGIYGNLREIRVLEGPRRQISNISIFNNVLGNSRGGRALVQVDDWTHQRSADDMNVRFAGNAYWLPATSSVAAISEWGDWPVRNHLNRTLAAHQRVSGEDDGAIVSTAAANPFVANDDEGDDRAPSTIRRGVAVVGWMATELGVPSGSRLPVGPTAITTPR